MSNPAAPRVSARGQMTLKAIGRANFLTTGSRMVLTTVWVNVPSCHHHQCFKITRAGTNIAPVFPQILMMP
jgi:hypothetical protein